MKHGIKYRFLCLFALLVLQFDISYAQNAFYIQETILNAGAKQTFSVNLKNSDAITAFQFDIKLPEGVIVEKTINSDDESILDIQLSARKKSSHSLSCILQEDGTYRIVVISMNNQILRDNDGAVVNIALSVSSTVTTGTYDIVLSNIHMVPMIDGVQGKRIEQADFATQIQILNSSQNDDVEAYLALNTSELVAGVNNQTIGVSLINNIEITALQFNVKLPNGLIVNDYTNDDGEVVPNIQLTSRKKSSHTIACNRCENGSYTIVIISMANQSLKGTDGEIVAIDVDVPVTMSGGYDVTLSDIHIVPLVNGGQGIRIDQEIFTHSININNKGGGDWGEPSGANTLTISPLVIKPGETGFLNIDMTNKSDICSFQMNIKLPKGLSIVKEYNGDDEYVEAINLTDRKKSSHLLSFKQTSDGGYFLLAYSLSNAVFRGNEGAVVCIKVKADENMNEGYYGVIVSNALMVTPDENRIEQEDYSATICVSNEDGIEEVSNKGDCNVRIVGSSLIIDELSVSEKIEIYNVSGILLISAKGDNGNIVIDCSPYRGQNVIVRIVKNDYKVSSIKLNL